MINRHFDVIVIGAGHNGLVAALCLTQKGMRVLVVEAANVIGGACRTEYPFKNYPGVPQSTGAYLLGPMPRELFQLLDVDAAMLWVLKKRRPHYFLPTLDGRHLLLSDDEAENNRQIERFFSRQDAESYSAVNAELGALRDDLMPCMLKQPLSIEETAERFVRPELREVMINLCRGSVAEYLNRHNFQSPLLSAMIAITDGLSGLNESANAKGTGYNLLMHNMCHEGTWDSVVGGMGTITKIFADKLAQRGGEIRLRSRVAGIRIENGKVRGVSLEDGTEIDAETVVVNADPFRMLKLIGEDNLPPDYVAKVNGYSKLGSTLKANLCLSGLPQFKGLNGDCGQFNGTTHIIPDMTTPYETLERSYQAARDGKLPDEPAIEIYFDRSLKDANGNFSAALFVPCMPFELKGTTWAEEKVSYFNRLLEVVNRFAPGISDLVVDHFILTPPEIESYFGITHGQIHHIANTWGLADRLPYKTPISGVYSASAGCHPGGSVTGAPGYNCATQVATDLGFL